MDPVRLVSVSLTSPAPIGVSSGPLVDPSGFVPVLVLVVASSGPLSCGPFRCVPVLVPRVPSGPPLGPVRTWPVSALGSQLTVDFMCCVCVWLRAGAGVGSQPQLQPSGWTTVTHERHAQVVAPTSSSLPGWWCLGRTTLASSPRYVAPCSSFLLGAAQYRTHGAWDAPLIRGGSTLRWL